MDNIRKLVKKTFRDVGIKFEIKTNLKTVNFLGVTFYNLIRNSATKCCISNLIKRPTHEELNTYLL